MGFGNLDVNLNFLVFAYGCLCHVQPNFIDDNCNEAFVKDILTKKQANYHNYSKAASLISKERSRLEKPPTIKKYYTTTCKHFSVLYQFIPLQKDIITSEVVSEKIGCAEKLDSDLVIL